MGEYDWFRSHVERLLQEIWGRHELYVDADGDYPYRIGTAAAWVHVEEGAPMAVRVFAHAAYGVKDTVALLREVNDLASRTRFGSVTVRGGVVVCEYALPAEAVTHETLHGVVSTVANQADELGTLLAAVFGGSTPFEDEEASESEADSDAA